MPRWTQESRVVQAAKIRGWKPWQKSTGPKTLAGKERTKLNAVKDGRHCTTDLNLPDKLRAYIEATGAKRISPNAQSYCCPTCGQDLYRSIWDELKTEKSVTFPLKSRD